MQLNNSPFAKLIKLHVNKPAGILRYCACVKKNPKKTQLLLISPSTSALRYTFDRETLLISDNQFEK